jgi:hypothetical protein
MSDDNLRYLDSIEPRLEVARSVRASDLRPPRGVPVSVAGQPPPIADWLVAGPFEGTAEDLGSAAGTEAVRMGRAAAGDTVRLGNASDALRPLDPAAVVTVGLGRIELAGLLPEEEPRALLLYGWLRCADAGLFRVHVDRLRARLFVGGVACEGGDFLRLEAGEYPVGVVLDNRRDYPWDKLYVSPRFVPCDASRLDARFRRRHERWAAARAARAGGADAALAGVRLLPETFIGTEGFIRAGRSERGPWWFVDVDGRPFCFKGVTSINRSGLAGGRRAKPGPYSVTVDRLHDYAAGPEPFVQACIAKLRDWGFNGMGSWTTEEFFEKGLYYTDNVEFNHGYARPEGLGFVDVFDPGWRAFIDAKARSICRPQRGYRWLVGYFTENEIGFPGVGTVEYDVTGKPIVTANLRPSLLQKCLARKPGQPCRDAAWQFVLARHRDPAGVAAAWEQPTASPDDVARVSAAGGVLATRGFARDAEDWAAHFAETFFRESALAIRRYDPNHLVLGCRWAGPPEAKLMEAESRWTDVLSLNNYQDMFFERLFEYHNPLDLPILVGEFCWSDDGHMTVRAPFEEPCGWTPDERMAENGAQAILRVWRHPNVVGFTWYRWVAENRLNSPRNCGLVNERDEPQPWNVDAFALLHGHVERTRAEAESAPETDCAGVQGAIVVTLAHASVGDGARGRRASKVVLGIRREDGRLLSALTGYGVEGSVRPAAGSTAAGRLAFHADVTFTQEVFPRGSGSGGYDVVLDRRRGAVLYGGYRGVCNGVAVEGRAVGWADGAGP